MTNSKGDKGNKGNTRLALVKTFGDNTTEGRHLCVESLDLNSLIEEIVSLGKGARAIEGGKRVRLQREIDALPAGHAEAFRKAFSEKLDEELLCSLGLTIPVITAPETGEALCPVVQLR